MAAFCTSCGAPVTGAFCGKCGAAQAAPAAPPMRQGSPLLKIILIVIAGFVLLGVLATAGLFYAGYKVKQKVEETAAERGINLRDLASQARASANAPARDGCPLLPKDEAQEIAGVPITRMDGAPGTGDNREHCDYFGGANVNQGEETQLFRFHVLRGRGRSQMAIIRTALTAAAGQSSGLTKVEGVGDEAVLGPMNASLYVRKDQDFVEIELGSLPDSKEKGIELARRIVSRL